MVLQQLQDMLTWQKNIHVIVNILTGTVLTVSSNEDAELLSANRSLNILLVFNSTDRTFNE